MNEIKSQLPIPVLLQVGSFALRSGDRAHGERDGRVCRMHVGARICQLALRARLVRDVRGGQHRKYSSVPGRPHFVQLWADRPVRFHGYRLLVLPAGNASCSDRSIPAPFILTTFLVRLYSASFLSFDFRVRRKLSSGGPTASLVECITQLTAALAYRNQATGMCSSSRGRRQCDAQRQAFRQNLQPSGVSLVGFPGLTKPGFLERHFSLANHLWL